MEKTENNLAKQLPDINDHNSFAKIIKNLFHVDFVFGEAGDGALSECWYERINGDGEFGSAWQAISSCRFKKIVFERDGALEKYIRKHIEKSNNDEDFEELNRTISIYRSIFLNKAS